MTNLTDKKLVSQVFLLLFLCLIVSACDNAINKQDEMTLVHIGFSDVSARSVLPVITVNDIAGYKLYGAMLTNPNQEETLLEEFKTLNNAYIYIRPVRWNFTLEAYNKNSDLALIGAVKNINITGDTDSVKFSLKPVKNMDYNGSALILIKLPNGSFVNSVETIIIKENNEANETVDPPLEIKNGNIRFEKSMQAGDYLIHFYLKDSKNRTLAVITEALVIRSRLESAKNITLTDADFNIPSAPVNLQLSSVSTVTASLLWKAANIANSYNVYRSQSVNGSFVKINAAAVNDTVFADNSIMPNKTYYYKVSSINGDIEGLQSASLRVDSLSSVPSNIRVSSVRTTRVSLAWNAVNGASSYNIYRSESANGTYNKVNTTVISGTTYNDNGVLPDKIYYYKICSINRDVEGILSSSLSATTLSSLPLNVRITSVKATRISFAWDSVIDSNSYNVYRSNSEKGTYVKINTAAVKNNEFTDTGLSGSTSYFYKIRAVFGNFEGLESLPLSVTTISSAISVQFEFNDPAEFEPQLPIIPDIIQVTEDSRVITILTTGTGWSNNYQWYLNGKKMHDTEWFSIGGIKPVNSNSIEINWRLPVGYYELSVVAIRNNVPYSVSAGFKVLNADSY